MPPKEQKTAVQASGGYDQQLIAKAPEITKADRQEGYDLNLVEQGQSTPLPPSSRPRTRNANPPPANPPASGSHSSLEKTAVTPPSASNGYSKNVTQSKSTPWYRTTKGLVIIIVVALVIVGVVVGAAVGVTQSKKSSNKSGALRDQNEITQASASSNTAAGGIFSTPAGFVSPSSGVVPPTAVVPSSGVVPPTPSLLTTASGFVSRSSGFVSPSPPDNVE